MASKPVVEYLNFCLKIHVTNLNHVKLEFVGAIIYHTHMRTKLKPMIYMIIITQKQLQNNKERPN